MLQRCLRGGLGLVALFVVCFGAASAQAPAPAAPLDHARVEAFVDGAVQEAMRAHHIAGVTVAIVDRSGMDGRAQPDHRGAVQHP